MDGRRRSAKTTWRMVALGALAFTCGCSNDLVQTGGPGSGGDGPARAILDGSRAPDPPDLAGGGGGGCGAGTLLCDGLCVDPKTSDSNCGGCGMRCAAGKGCVAGR